MKRLVLLIVVFVALYVVPRSYAWDWGRTFKEGLADALQSGAGQNIGGTMVVTFCGYDGLEGWLKEAQRSCPNGYDIIRQPQEAECLSGSTGFEGAIRCSRGSE